jgi:hypothetical protein
VSVCRLSEYRTFLAELPGLNRRVGGVADFLEGRLGQRDALILRHDVDRRLGKTLVMAEMEGRAGGRASYYFRRARRGFPAHAIRRVAELGHEIGYHYETLSAARGDSVS